jgi:hypothetical protein
MYISSSRGYGAGPNGGKGFKPPVQGSYVGDIQLGTFQQLKTPNAAELAKLHAGGSVLHFCAEIDG